MGQGIGNAVGLAVAEAHLATTFNQPGHEIVDHYTYFICSDGDLMEGISHEAASFAGHYKLGKLIGFYDDNHITIDGSTDLTFTDDTAKRFGAYGWQVLHIGDVNDLDQIEAAIGEAQSDPDRPTLIVTRTHIGFGSPRQYSERAHGEAFSVENECVVESGGLGLPSELPSAVCHYCAIISSVRFEVELPQRVSRRGFVRCAGRGPRSRENAGFLDARQVQFV